MPRPRPQLRTRTYVQHTALANELGRGVAARGGFKIAHCISQQGACFSVRVSRLKSIAIYHKALFWTPTYSDQGPSTGFVKKARPRLRDSASWLLLAAGISSRNLEPTSLTMPVVAN